MQEKAICFSGHGSEKLPKGKKQLQNLTERIWREIDTAIANGVKTFYFGACSGFDLLCADIVLKRRRVIKPSDPKEIILIAVIPFEEQAKNWDETIREIYYDTLAQCDEVLMLNSHYYHGCCHECNRYMVDLSSKLICYYNNSNGETVYTVRYSKHKKSANC